MAASANMSHAAKEVASVFELRTGCQVKLSFAASGTIYSQIINGAPFDVFLSADSGYPERLEKAGEAVKGSRRTYALGRLVVWSSTAKEIDTKRLQMKGLSDKRVKRIAIANPRHAPYGRAAVEALRYYGIYERVRPKLVLAESLGHAAQLVDSGAAQIGIIGLSLVVSKPLEGKGVYWVVPERAHRPIEQAVVVPRRSGKRISRAMEFVDFLVGARGREILGRYGYSLPDVNESVKQ